MDVCEPHVRRRGSSCTHPRAATRTPANMKIRGFAFASLNADPFPSDASSGRSSSTSRSKTPTLRSDQGA